MVVSLDGLDSSLQAALLVLIMNKGRLTFRLAKLFLATEVRACTDALCTCLRSRLRCSPQSLLASYPALICFMVSVAWATLTHASAWPRPRCVFSVLCTQCTCHSFCCLAILYVIGDMYLSYLSYLCYVHLGIAP